MSIQSTTEQAALGLRSPTTETAALRPYVSSAAKQFAPGNFVTTWNPEIGRDAVGVTRAVEDVTEANPRILVKWMHDLSEEWVRSEYLYIARMAAIIEQDFRNGPKVNDADFNYKHGWIILDGQSFSPETLTGRPYDMTQGGWAFV